MCGSVGEGSRGGTSVGREGERKHKRRTRKEKAIEGWWVRRERKGKGENVKVD